MRKRQRKKNLKKLGLWLDKGQRSTFIKYLRDQSIFMPGPPRVIPMRAES